MNAGVNRPLRVALATCTDKPELSVIFFDGALCVIELELTEPSLYLRWDSAAADRLAAAMERRGR